MRAKDLRIGNLIASGANKEDSETWVIGNVFSISNEDFQFEQIEVETDEGFTWFFKDSYWGIPLTEELLTKLGFENGGYDFLFWYKDEIEFAGINWADADEPDYQFLTYRGRCNSDSKSTRIYYVHQLQNLYFALTNEELTIK